MTTVLLAAFAAWTFAEESVTTVVAADRCEVTGTYTFRCAHDAPDLPILYPFPDDPSLGEPEPVVVALVCTGGTFDPLPFHVFDDGWRWIVPGGGAGTRTVRVVYRQAMSDGRATYVLRSTQRWGVPLEQALLQVEVPADWEVSIEPRLELVTASGRTRVYRAEFRNWMPEMDLTVSRQRPPLD
jgi:hypothetical protein